ncbi:MAG TPA: alpha/beta fold hydrolase [Stackebrandtia sp.]|jgi:predicted alpha/beta hydrolase|uniref:alpha/beta hydrolase family protein n=1 Tax=Stackebrandtia sp. TaxID=2023065 RepID=UPI002D311AAE|nr:alpha/beta fold hydrolase [Stackebrandtia sp.]HZE41571.1 alpha/beta fold hydrolase [Stackebrandtia sp.]
MADYAQEYIDGDGFRLGVHRYRCDDGPAVVMLPAMGVPAGYYRRFAVALGSGGADVTVADMRGTGSSMPRPARAVDFGYQELLDDIDALCDLVRDELAGRPVLFMGHSLGGQLALLHLARQRPTGLDVRGVAVLASGLPYGALYGPRGVMVSGLARVMTTTSALYGHWPGYGFAGRQPRRLIGDWAHTVRTGRFPRLDGRDSEAGLAELKLPVLAVTMQGDKHTPEVTSRFLTAKLASARVEEYRYRRDTAGTELDHFTWARHSGPLIERLRAFIDGL